ncbi:two-component system response regulator [Curvibacter sp. HBC28]|uniref:Two-component system response regulator n=1 Tax=Curvibacter microcysteis TaxID=3026419 RepID=A0ABT5MDG8_9BURK|nr:two-component system response regulator [Curvibacter sp. HBC28]MDD0813932.1 two-component system response regulator [Curvibacter sp. HBC28]
MSERDEVSDRPVVLVVDDMPDNLTVLGELLQADYRVRAANSGPAALRLAASEPQPDLILLDVMMPGMDGLEVLRQLQADPALRHIPVLFVTAMDDTADEAHGLALGALDYITKPLRPAIVKARVKTQLELKRARDLLARQNASLEAEVARRMAENQRIQHISIHALARLAETRDPETGNHLLRTQSYVRLLGEHLAPHPRFAAELSPLAIDKIAKSAPLHDIGKVGIPDQVLLKPGKLNPEEWTLMKTHALLGATAIERAEQDLADEGGPPIDFLAYAKQIARHHHERWDGQGYPDGLAGEDIPVAARLMALADVFDALISRRVYKPPFSFEAARELILADSGRQFDPDVCAAFEACYLEFCAVAERYLDTEEAVTAKYTSLGGAA